MFEHTANQLANRLMSGIVNRLANDQLFISHSVGRYIEGTIETIDDLELSIISMVFLNYRQFSIVFNSVSDRECKTDFYYFYSYLLFLFQFLDFFFPKKSCVQFIENLQDGRHRICKCDVLSSNLPAFSLLINNILQKNCSEGAFDIFQGKGTFYAKINTTFFIRNQVPDISLLNNFFEKSSIFREKREKLF